MKLRTCPQCGSRDIRLDPKMAISGLSYKCDTCGYTGNIIGEQDIDRKFRK